MTDVLFIALALLAVVSGWRVFRTWSMTRAAFFLLTSFGAVAGVLLLLASEFLGGITLLMMIGEMVIMAIFMVMFMPDPAGLMKMSMGGSLRLPTTVSAAAFASLSAVALGVDWPQRRGDVPADVTYAIGIGMMEDKMLVFLAAGVALLGCMIASLVLALHRGRYHRYGDDLDRREPTDPIRGGVGR